MRRCSKRGAVVWKPDVAKFAMDMPRVLDSEIVGFGRVAAELGDG